MSALFFADRVMESTLTTGTGTVALEGAYSADHFSFSSAGANGKRVPYRIESGNGTDVEIGIGTYTSSGSSLSRDQILRSTNSNAAISLTGTSLVYLDVPAEFYNDLVLDVKVLVCAPTNINLATDCEAGDTLNGVVLQVGDPIFTPYQSTAADRRLWKVAASGAPIPHPLMPTGAVISHYKVTTSEGTLLKDRIFMQTANTVTVGSGGLTWNITNETSSEQAALTVLKGPESGADASPTFGLLTPPYIPLLPYQFHNLAVNSGFWFGSMRKDPSNTASISDDNYGMDWWNILSQGGTALVSRITGTNGQYAIQIQNNTGSDSRLGTCEIIESVDTYPVRGKTMTFKCRVRCSQTKNLRISIISVVGGNNDVVTSDIIGTWTSTNYTSLGSGNFFIDPDPDGGFDTSEILTAQVACTANTWRDAVVSGTVSVFARNLIISVTCDEVLSNNAYFNIEDVDFYLGTEVTTARPRMPIILEQMRSERCFVPFHGQQYQDGYQANGSQIYMNNIDFRVPMRAIPTGYVTTTPTYNNASAGASQVAAYNRSTGAFATISGALTMYAISSSKDRGRIYLSAGTSFNGANGAIMALDFGSDFHGYWSAAL